MILAPAAMTAEKDQKKAAQKCFDEVALDPDMYRIGHTKASEIFYYRNDIRFPIVFFSFVHSPNNISLIQFECLFLIFTYHFFLDVIYIYTKKIKTF